MNNLSQRFLYFLRTLTALLALFYLVAFFGFSLPFSLSSFLNYFLFLWGMFFLIQATINRTTIIKPFQKERKKQLLNSEKLKNNLLLKTDKRKKNIIKLFFINFSVFINLLISFTNRFSWLRTLSVAFVILIILQNSFLNSIVLTDILVFCLYWVILTKVFRLGYEYSFGMMIFFILLSVYFQIKKNDISAERSAVWFNMMLILGTVQYIFETKKIFINPEYGKTK